MSLITWLFVGIVCGLLASLLPRIAEQPNLRINILVGMVGAIAAGIFITPMFDIVTKNQRNFSFPSMLVSIGGAIPLILVVYVIRRLRVAPTS